ncbi:MAG: nuclear transport factor 2 family protein [Caulobacterales bacterium]
MTLSLQEISDHIEIRQVLATYSRGVDRWDRELLKSIYHPDGRDDHTVYNGLGWGFADFIVDTCTQMKGPSQHHLTNIYIELHGDAANVETYYIAYHATVDERGETLLNTGGRYLDRFERRDGVWKIAHRICTIDWSRAALPGEPWEGAKPFPHALPKGQDAMYELFART